MSAPLTPQRWRVDTPPWAGLCHLCHRLYAGRIGHSRGCWWHR